VSGELDGDPYTHIVTHMKTTVEIRDDLMAAVKAAAAERKVTFKELLNRALEKDVMPAAQPENEDHFIIDEDGWPVFNRKDFTGTPVTDEFVRQLREQEGI
jgi:hypothetical protein